jgi:nickel transport protein
MRRRMPALTFAVFAMLALTRHLHAHTVNYDVQQKGISVRIFYTADDPANYAEYELFGPEDAVPYATGRTDKRGFLCFLPDRKGEWKVKVLGESSHGFHGVTVSVNVNEAMDVESFKKPLVARHTKLVAGISIIFGLFGLMSLLANRRKKCAEVST